MNAPSHPHRGKGEASKETSAPDPARINISLSASPPDEETKRCTGCGWELRLSQFARDASKASGFKSSCKACDREKSRRYYEQNREKKLAYMNTRNAALREARGLRGRRSQRRAA